MVTIHFNPRPPRGGRPYPTQPLRACGYFNPRPPRGGRRSNPSARYVQLYFNPRPPRGGRPRRRPRGYSACHYFNPRPPRGGRPFREVCPYQRRGISIHALREEGDQPLQPLQRRPCHFNPRPPRGGRLPRNIGKPCERDFNPRPPRGGRPFSHPALVAPGGISIHALREEGDLVGRFCA